MSKYRTADVARLAAMFKALSNPARLRIFLRLAAGCVQGGCSAGGSGASRCCAGDLGADLALAPSTVSHHLKELRQAGLMEVERRGQRVECRVGDEALRILSALFAGAGGRTRPVPPKRGRGSR